MNQDDHYCGSDELTTTVNQVVGCDKERRLLVCRSLANKSQVVCVACTPERPQMRAEGAEKQTSRAGNYTLAGQGAYL